MPVTTTDVGGLSISLAAESAAVGVIVARGCREGAAPAALDREIERAVEEAAARTDVQDVTAAVRDLLRFGRYKPTGRGKPSSEYLLNAARARRFPRVSCLVDINNLVSLRTLLPISLVDLDRAASAAFVIRRGRPGESYVFNRAGQSIDLEDLLLVATLPDDVPCANAVKDAMATKLTEESRNIMAVIYAPEGMRERLAGAADGFAQALRDWGSAEQVTGAVVGR